MTADINSLIKRNITDLEILILALLYARGKEGIKGDIFFQKELFLISNYIERIRNKTDFIPHFLGPYSESGEKSLDNLVSYKLVEKEKGKYNLTKKGISMFEDFKIKISLDEFEAIEDFKLFLNNLKRDELLVFIYASYPDYTTESVIKEKVLKNRIPISISLYKKEKVSLEKAAFLAGMSLEDFIYELRRQNENI